MATKHPTSLNPLTQVENKPWARPRSGHHLNLGDNANEIGYSLLFIAETAEEDSNWAAALRYRKESYEWHHMRLGADSFYTQKERLSLATCELMASLTPDQQQEALLARRQHWEALALYEKGDFGAAKKLAESVAEVRKQLLGDQHPDYAASQANVAMLTMRMGDLALAEKMYNEVLRIQRETIGERHPDYMTSLGNLGWIACKLNDYARAESLFEQALTLQKKTGRERHPEFANALSNLGTVYRLTSDYAKAEPLLLEASQIMMQATGEQSAPYAISLQSLAALYQAKGEYRRAELTMIQTLKIQKEALGINHVDYATSLGILAEICQNRNDYVRAEPLLKDALRIQKAIMGTEHAEYASTLVNLALLYQAKGEFARAKSLFEEAKGIFKQVYGESHEFYAKSLRHLASVDLALGNYDQAERQLSQALEILGRNSDEGTPAYAMGLDAMATLNRERGQLKQAEALYQQALEIRSKYPHRREDHATSLGNLAALYDALGDYARAEPLLFEAITIRKSLNGENHPRYATSLNNLAAHYSSMGEYAKSEPLFRRVVDVYKQSFGSQHPDYAVCLNNLAWCCNALLQYENAAANYVEALQVYENAFGKQHPKYASTLSSYARNQAQMGDRDLAETLHLESLEIHRKLNGDQHPHYASCLNNLGVFYNENRQFEKSEPLLTQALEIRKQVFGNDHPLYAESLNNIAAYYTNARDFTRAEALYYEAIEIQLANLEESANVLSQQRQLVMAQSVGYLIDNYIRCCLALRQLPSRGAEVLIAWKGAVLVRSRAVQIAASDPIIAKQLSKVQAISRRLSDYHRTLPSSSELVQWKRGLDQLNAEKEQAESGLMQMSAEIRRATHRATIKEVCDAIPVGAVLVNFVVYNAVDGPSILASLVYRNGKSVMMDLGSVESANAAIEIWRKTYGMALLGTAAGQKLRDQIWEPLLPFVRDAKLIFVSMDGALGRLPLVALPGSEPDTYLIEDHRIAMVPVPRLLPALIANETREMVPHAMLLMGDIDYDADANARGAKLSEINSSIAVDPSVQVGTAPPSSSNSMLADPILGDGIWSPLVGTRIEVEFIGGLYQRLYHPPAGKILDLRNDHATESAFREHAPKSRCVHLATHGFFSDPSAESALSIEMIKKAFFDYTEEVEKKPQVAKGYNPGLLSGIVFAGANRTRTKFVRAAGGTNTSSDFDDGIVTAEEIASMQLGNVRLAVLSACETGLGEVAGGEGMLGLQRAFQIAGARTTVTSLWAVNDLATSWLMQEFYRNQLEPDRRLPVLDALREAQLAVMRSETAAQKEFASQNNSTPPPRLSPQIWAPFVLTGDWR